MSVQVDCSVHNINKQLHASQCSSCQLTWKFTDKNNNNNNNKNNNNNESSNEDISCTSDSEHTGNLGLIESTPYYNNREDRGWLYFGVISVISIVLVAFILLFLWPRPVSVHILNSELINIHITANSGHKIRLNFYFHTNGAESCSNVKITDRNTLEKVHNILSGDRSRDKEEENESINEEGVRKLNISCYQLHDGEGDVHLNYSCDTPTLVRVTTQLSTSPEVEERGENHEDGNMKPLICFNETLERF